MLDKNVTDIFSKTMNLTGGGGDTRQTFSRQIIVKSISIIQETQIITARRPNTASKI